VSLVDVAPTVLDLLGLPPSAAMEGETLRPLLRSNGPDRDAYAQTSYGEGLVALRSGGWKYVFKPPERLGPDPDRIALGDATRNGFST
jgi:arylsulfatase A-like enzyme